MRQAILMQFWGHFDKELGPNFVHRNASWHLVLDQFEPLVQLGLRHYSVPLSNDFGSMNFEQSVSPIDIQNLENTFWMQILCK